MPAAPLNPSAKRFADRGEAGRELGSRLSAMTVEDPVVIGLPRGGVPVAEQVAKALGAPLAVLAVRKLGAPHNPEYGIGAIAEDGTCVVDPEALTMLGIGREGLDEIVARAAAELRRRVEVYGGERVPLRLEGRTVIVVDDGVATGVTDTAALRAVRRQQPRRLVLAVPVCPPESAARLRQEADEFVCLIEPPLLQGVGQWYVDFSQVSDDEVMAALRAARESAPPPGR
jgi:putative phosphoribosyl transferase